MAELKNRLSRIREYIDRRRGKQLTVLFRTPDGAEWTGSVDDLIAAKGEFLRIRSGNSMSDLDKLLLYEHKDYKCVID